MDILAVLTPSGEMTGVGHVTVHCSREMQYPAWSLYTAGSSSGINCSEPCDARMLSMIFTCYTMFHLTSRPWYRNRSAPSDDVLCLDNPAPNGTFFKGSSISAISSNVRVGLTDAGRGSAAGAAAGSTVGSARLLANAVANLPSSIRIWPFTNALLCALAIWSAIFWARPVGDRPRCFSLIGRRGLLTSLSIGSCHSLRDRLLVFSSPFQSP